jgi:hypothetical protein
LEQEIAEFPSSNFTTETFCERIHVRVIVLGGKSTCMLLVKSHARQTAQQLYLSKAFHMPYPSHKHLPAIKNSNAILITIVDLE